MAIDLDPKLWLDEDAGVTNTVVTEGAGKAGYIKIYGSDADGGIPGLNLANGAGDAVSVSRIMRSILEYMYQYQETLTAANKPTSVVISRSASTSGTSMYNTYSLRFKMDAEVSEPITEP
jgi:RecB family endonuclease NucS